MNKILHPHISRSGMMLFIIILLLTKPSLGQEPPAPPNDRMDEFLRVYPEAEAKLDKAYSHLRMKAIKTVTAADKNSPLQTLANPPQLWATECDILREGEYCRVIHTTLQSPDPKYPVGTINISRFGPDYCVFFSRKAGQPDFLFDLYRPLPHHLEESFWNAHPLMAAYVVDNDRVSGLLQKMEPIAINDYQFGDVSLIGVDLVDKTPEPDQTRFTNYRLYFHPSNLALAGWVEDIQDADQFKVQVASRIEYEPGPVPLRIKSVQRWLSPVPGIGLCTHLIRTDVKELVFEPIPMEKFTFQAMGVAHPPEKFLEDGEIATVPATQPAESPATRPASSAAEK